MPKVSRSRTIGAPVERVWDLISDPHSLPRWWPRIARVEDVQGKGERSRWTAVLQTERGTGVRADYRCSASTNRSRFAWQQDLAGTPFERILRESRVEVQLEPQNGESTEVRLESEERLRGLSRFGSALMRGATRRRLDEALDGIDLGARRRTQRMKWWGWGAPERAPRDRPWRTGDAALGARRRRAGKPGRAGGGQPAGRRTAAGGAERRRRRGERPRRAVRSASCAPVARAIRT